MRFLFFLLLVIIISSCTQKRENVSCYYCWDYYPPQHGEVEVLVSINDDNSWVPITIYEGYQEQNQILLHDTINVETAYYNLAPGYRYAIEAVYRSGQKQIIALDGKLFDYYENTDCYEGCYMRENWIFDLRLATNWR